MIQHLKGAVIWADSRYFVLEVNGIGYKIFATNETCSKAYKKINDLFPVWTHEVVREDANDLYGFVTKEDLDFFELLITVSGIGPKSALGVMNVSPVDSLKMAIAASDTNHLTKVSGIGKKLAEKIVLELKDKITGIGEDNSASLKDEAEALEALKSLGYGHNEVREALKSLPSAVIGTKDKIKQALKILGK